MTNINTACVKNNASYQLNNALPNKETISSLIFVNDWHNGVISRLIMVKKEQLPWSELKKLTIRTWHLLICHILI